MLSILEFGDSRRIESKVNDLVFSHLNHDFANDTLVTMKQVSLTLIATDCKLSLWLLMQVTCGFNGLGACHRFWCFMGSGQTYGVLLFNTVLFMYLFRSNPQWGAADAEIKVPSGENTELKRSPCKAWSRSVYSPTCYAYCQEFLPYFYPSGPFTCIFSKTSPNFSRIGCC